MALIPLNTFKTKTAVLTTLNYNQAKCSRDTGLMVDSIAFDLLFGGTTQTAFAATQYWSQGTSKIAGEVFQTLSALEHAKTIAKMMVVNTTITASVGNTAIQNASLPAGSSAAQTIIDSEFDLIMDIIENGIAGTTNKIITNTGSVTNTSFDTTTDIGIIRAAAILDANKLFLQSEVVAFVNNRFNGGYVYDQTKCRRDTGLIVDSLAFDLLFDGNTQSSYAGLQYWTQGSTNIPGESTQTLASLEYLKTTIDKIITNQPVTVSIGNKLAQVSNQTLITSKASKDTIDNLLTNIINIITDGTSSTTIDGVSSISVTDAIVPNSELTTDELILNAYTLLQNNKNFLKLEIINWINNRITSNTSPFTSAFVYDSDKCSRDVGYIIDCISFDLIYGGNRQSLQAGTYYFGFSDTSAIDSGIVVNAGSFVRGTAYIIVATGNTSFTSIGAPNNAPGTLFVASGIGGGSGTAKKADEISESVSAYNYMKTLVSNVITGQPITELYQTTVDQIITTSYGTDTEITAIHTNIDLITNIIKNGPSVAPDPQPISLIATVNQNAQDASSLLLANKEFIKAEVIAYINSTTEFNTVKAGYFIAGVVYTIETLGNTDFTAIGASANTVGLAFTATGTGNISTTGTANAGFKYTNSNVYNNTNKCYRDIGYIVDCINFDLLYPGNRQAIQAGVYYFNNSSTTSVVAAEKTDTINAYNYMAIVMSRVIENIPLTQLYVSQQINLNGSKYLAAPYQKEVVQNINLKTPSTASVVVTNTISLISNTMIPIIANGTSSAPPRVPISLTPPANVDNIRAYDILMANKDYITAEVIGYMNALTSPNTTKIYTTPPGTTAIVLMAQVANVTDHNINVTFAHYRNLPVFADPSTLNGYQAPNVVTEVVKNYTIPPNDAATLIQGKMIIESFDSIVAYASESHGLKVTLSILETANA